MNDTATIPRRLSLTGTEFRIYLQTPMFALKVRRRATTCLLCLNRQYSSGSAGSSPLIRIRPHSEVHAFGGGNKRSEPLFQTGDQGWTVRPGEAWGVIGQGTSNLFQVGNITV